MRRRERAAGRLGSAIAALGVACALAACGSDSAPPREGAPATGSHASLPAGAVARIGTALITKESIAALAAEQKVTPARAMDVAVHDALLARGAAEAGLDADPSVQTSTRGVLARALLRDIQANAGAEGPVTDDELREVTARHWLDLDRPEGFHAVHAVVRLDANASEQKRQEARALATAIRGALADVSDLASRSEPGKIDAATKEDPIVAPFKAAAVAVPHDGFDVVAEDLPAVAADGRVLSEKGGRFDPAFAAAASALRRRGELSPPIASSFGIHVILLLELSPSHVLPEGERRRLVRDEVLTARAQRAYGELMGGLRAQAAVDPNAEALLVFVPVEP